MKNPATQDHRPVAWTVTALWRAGVVSQAVASLWPVRIGWRAYHESDEYLLVGIVEAGIMFSIACVAITWTAATLAASKNNVTAAALMGLVPPLLIARYANALGLGDYATWVYLLVAVWLMISLGAALATHPALRVNQA